MVRAAGVNMYHREAETVLIKIFTNALATCKMNPCLKIIFCLILASTQPTTLLCEAFSSLKWNGKSCKTYKMWDTQLQRHVRTCWITAPSLASEEVPLGQLVKEDEKADRTSQDTSKEHEWSINSLRKTPGQSEWLLIIFLKGPSLQPAAYFTNSFLKD